MTTAGTVRPRPSGPRRGLAALVTTALSLGLAATAGPPAAAALGTDTLVEGEQLVLGNEGEFLRSANGQHLLEWSGSEGIAIVAQTSGSTYVYGVGEVDFDQYGSRFIVQGDGNVVLYDDAGAALWSTGTASAEAVRLVLQDDANLVLYTASGRALWASGATQDSLDAYQFSEFLIGPSRLRPGWSLISTDRRYRLTLQADGNVVLYGPGGSVRFTTRTTGGTEFVAQEDGNLVLYAGSRVLWQSGAARRVDPVDPYNYRTVLQTDGNFVTYGDRLRDETGSRPIWSSARGRLR